ncbi:hypothetical protein CEQ90_10000 [Lewinellaceae bacterium SD302]|nr:hypothetical protein CEQ90_10000 [Lewinellaceae bacterium SD302]
MKKIIRIFSYIAISLILYFVLFLGYGTMTDWEPEEQEVLTVIHPGNPKAVIQDSVISLLTWNVGYGGLGEEVAFFYDEGDFFWTTPGHARQESATVDKAVNGQETTIGAVQADFYLLQEVDTSSRRSHYTNQLDSMALKQANHAVFFAMNYRNERVPIPVFQPWDHYGYVRGGLVSMNGYAPLISTRESLPGELEWPTNLFELDRCVLRQEFSVKGDQKLVVYNIHLAAYDKGGVVKRQQMAWLKEHFTADYAAGNHVIVGGDWNQVPPGFDYAKFSPERRAEFEQIAIDFDYAPEGWLWAYDPTLPTNRKTNEVYDSENSLKSLIDYYLVSPNLQLRKVKTINQEFAFSDHQPVYLEVMIK